MSAKATPTKRGRSAVHGRSRKQNAQPKRGAPRRGLGNKCSSRVWLCLVVRPARPTVLILASRQRHEVTAIPMLQAVAAIALVPIAIPVSSPRRVSVIGANGWYSANRRSPAGIVVVGTKPVLRKGKRVRNIGVLLAVSTLFAVRPSAVASHTNASENVTCPSSLPSKESTSEGQPARRGARIWLNQANDFTPQSCPAVLRIADRCVVAKSCAVRYEAVRRRLATDR